MKKRKGTDVTQQQEALVTPVATLIFDASDGELSEIECENLARKILRRVVKDLVPQKPRCAVCGKEQARWMWLPHGLHPGNTFALPEHCLPIGYKCKAVLETGQPLPYTMDGHSYVANQKGGA